jgi:hypothetical protein
MGDPRRPDGGYDESGPDDVSLAAGNRATAAEGRLGHSDRGPLSRPTGYPAGMLRSSTCAAETVDGLSAAAAPVLPARVDDGREQILDVLRAGGLRFRAGGRWRSTL